MTLGIPEGWTLREDLRCPRCNRYALERTDSTSAFRFSCIGYWGNGPKCWTCASPVGSMIAVGTQQTLF